MSAKERGRRRFLQDSAVLAGLAVGAVRSASGQTPGSEKLEVQSKDLRAYGERSRFDKSTRWPLVAGSSPSQTPLQELEGIITPSALHFQIGGGFPPPDLDPRQHRLMIHGMVERPLLFTMEELKRLPSVSRIHFIECAGNTVRPDRETVQQSHGATSCSEWTGVLLSVLLQEAGVQKGANWLVAEGAEPGMHTRSILLEKAMDDCIVAYAQNGEVVRPEQGYPLRLVAPGWEGNINVKWLRRIKLVDQPYMTQAETTKYTSLRPDGTARWYQFELGPKSVITRPSGGQKLPGKGFYEITGLAWSGGGVITRVEISTDGGRSWKNAELQEPVHRIAHTRFRLPWTWDGEEAVLQSRCTDERGGVQPSLEELSKMWGAPPAYWESHLSIHFNPIQSWRVTREGSVQNAL